MAQCYLPKSSRAIADALQKFTSSGQEVALPVWQAGAFVLEKGIELSITHRPTRSHVSEVEQTAQAQATTETWGLINNVGGSIRKHVTKQYAPAPYSFTEQRCQIDLARIRGKGHSGQQGHPVDVFP